MNGTGRIYKRGKIWWVDYSFRGKRRRESSKSTLRKDALALLRQRQAEMAQGHLTSAAEERLTFEDLASIIVADYERQDRKSKDRLAVSLKALRGFFADDRALDITSGRIDAYVGFRRSQGRANSTIRNELNALRRSMKLAVQSGKLSRVPHFNTPPADNVRHGFFTRTQFEAVARHLPIHARTIAHFAFLTGWRIGEIVGLTWAQVDFESGVIRLEPGTTKNDQGREIPFAAFPELHKLLIEQRNRTDRIQKAKGTIVPWVFHRKGNGLESIRTAWNRACRLGGMPGAWFHDLRRSAVRNMERAGVSRSVAMKITGHKTESIYKRYAIVDRASMEEGLRKLSNLGAVDASDGTQTA